MRAGRLDRMVTLQQRVPTRNSFNEQIDTWTELATVPASALFNRGQERFVAQQAAAEVDVLFTIRWRADITPMNRLVFEGRTYNIVSVAELPRRRGLELMATARAE